MQPRTPQETQTIIDANPHLSRAEIERDLAEHDRLLAERFAADPSAADPASAQREARLQEIAHKLFHT